jgi:hypothetical protein
MSSFTGSDRAKAREYFCNVCFDDIKRCEANPDDCPGAAHPDDPHTQAREEYPQREIFRRGGRYAMCQVMTKWTSSADCPKYIACNDLQRGDQFIARMGMGTWCEVDVIELADALKRLPP